jgi:hypothetical protein
MDRRDDEPIPLKEVEMSSYLVPPVWQPLDGNGKPYPAAKLYCYEAGTTSDLAVYSSSTLTEENEHEQPVVANSNGVFPQIYLSSDVYKFVLKTSAGVEIDTYDDISSLVAGDGGTLPIANGGTNAGTGPDALTSLGAAAQTDYTTLNSTVGDIDSELSGIGGSLGAVAALAEVDVANLAAGIDVAYNFDLTTDNDTVVSTMEITDGTQRHSRAFTPTRDDSTIYIIASGTLLGSEGAIYNMGIFRTGTTAALAAGRVETNGRQARTLIAKHVPGTADAQTYSIRSTGTGMEDSQLLIFEVYTTV